MNMPTGHFDMAPLDSFVVTEQRHERLQFWEAKRKYALRYELIPAHKIVRILSRKPPLLDVFLAEEDSAAGWRIEWQV